ncbi:MAG: hypothetical protein JWN30_390 [Bacilli bacterium]|nr:hypothetical protein [Bacilli bacterium]
MQPFNGLGMHAGNLWHYRQPLRAPFQALGWRSERRFYPGQHDICSVAYWYQTLPAAEFSKLPSRDELEIV